MAANDFQTMFAQRATAVAVQFNVTFAKRKLEPGYAVDITSPDGPSTAGGVQAAQSVRLHSPDGAPPLVMARVDTNAGTAVMRTYQHLEQLHAQRATSPFLLSEGAYEAFLAEAREFFDERQLKVTTEPTPALAPRPSAPIPMKPAELDSLGKTRFRNGFMAGLVVGLLVGVAAATLLFR